MSFRRTQWTFFDLSWLSVKLDSPRIDLKNIVSQEENLYDRKVFILADLDASLLNIHTGCLKKPRQPNVES